VISSADVSSFDNGSTASATVNTKIYTYCYAVVGCLQLQVADHLRDIMGRHFTSHLKCICIILNIDKNIFQPLIFNCILSDIL